jgi:hypothetical protein
MESTKEYVLQSAETAVLQGINLSVLNTKARIYDLQVALEQARADLSTRQAHFTGAVSLLANSHGMSAAQVTPDLARIVAQ